MIIFRLCPCIPVLSVRHGGEHVDNAVNLLKEQHIYDCRRTARLLAHDREVVRRFCQMAVIDEPLGLFISQSVGMSHKIQPLFVKDAQGTLSRSHPCRRCRDPLKAEGPCLGIFRCVPDRISRGFPQRGSAFHMHLFRREYRHQYRRVAQKDVVLHERGVFPPASVFCLRIVRHLPDKPRDLLLLLFRASQDPCRPERIDCQLFYSRGRDRRILCDRSLLRTDIILDMADPVLIQNSDLSVKLQHPAERRICFFS